MTRYNSEANEPYVGMKEEHIPIEQLEGYREAVDRIIAWVEYEGLACSHDLRNAIDKGEI